MLTLRKTGRKLTGRKMTDSRRNTRTRWNNDKMSETVTKFNDDYKRRRVDGIEPRFEPIPKPESDVYVSTCRWCVEWFSLSFNLWTSIWPNGSVLHSEIMVRHWVWLSMWMMDSIKNLKLWQSVPSSSSMQNPRQRGSIQHPPGGWTHRWIDGWMDGGWYRARGRNKLGWKFWISHPESRYGN